MFLRRVFRIKLANPNNCAFAVEFTRRDKLPRTATIKAAFLCYVADDKMTMDGSKSEPGKNGATQQECAGCGKAITER